MTSMSLTVRSPIDAACMMPVVLGFVPENSITMMTFGAPRPFHARIDLPDNDDDLGGAVAALVYPCAKHGVRQVLLTVWADQTPWAWTVLDRMTVGMIEAGVEVTTGLVIDSTHVWMDSERGAPYDIWSHPAVAQAVLSGRVIEASRTTLRQRVAYSPDATAPIDLDEYDLDNEEDRDRLTMTGRGEAQQQHLAEMTKTLATLSDLDPRLPHVAAATAFCAWQCGHGALAWIALDRVPHSRQTDLHQLVEQALTLALPPQDLP